MVPVCVSARAAAAAAPNADTVVSPSCLVSNLHQQPRVGGHGQLVLQTVQAAQCGQMSDPDTCAVRLCCHCWRRLDAGDYTSASRFIRMAMLKRAALSSCWATEFSGEQQRLSPGVVPGGYPATNPTLLAVMGILQSVYLPRGGWGALPGRS